MKIVITVKDTDNVIGLKEDVAMRLEGVTDIVRIDTADVVPRAEVESLLDELIKEAGEIADAYKKDADKMSVSDFAKAEYRGTQIGALLVQYKIAELKKKYAEDE